MIYYRIESYNDFTYFVAACAVRWSTIELKVVLYTTISVLSKLFMMIYYRIERMISSSTLLRCCRFSRWSTIELKVWEQCKRGSEDKSRRWSTIELKDDRARSGGSRREKRWSTIELKVLFSQRYVKARTTRMIYYRIERQTGRCAICWFRMVRWSTIELKVQLEGS